MKYNISNPTTGQNLVKEIDDDKINRHFNDRRMGSDVDGEVIGEEFKGYTLRITGGNDKQGFAMKQGILVNARIKILLRKKTTLYRPRRTGERKRKSVRGCICGPDLAVIFLRVLEKGIGEVTGLTDKEQPRRLGPKRANHIRSAFALRKKDDVRKYIVSRAIEKKVKKKGDEATEIEKTFYKSPKIQRLITEKRLRRKKLNAKSKKDKWASAKEAHVAYEKLLSKFLKEKKAAYKESHQSKPEEKKPAAPVTPAKPAKAAKAAKAEVKKEAPKAKPEKTKGKK